MAAAIRVLYVDDEPDLLDIGKLFLEESGDFTVTTALSGTEGIRLLEEEKFDAIVSDYQMPGMDGIQFLVEVRSRFGPIPFILFTGRGREEVVIQAINSGADFYLQKGGEPGAQFAELSHKVRQAALRNRAEDSLRNSEEQHQTILQTTLDGIWMVDAEGKITEVNETYCRMSGYTRTELLNLHITDLDAVEKPAETAAHIQSIVENGSGIFESSHRRKDGSVFDVEISTMYLNADGGKFICFCRDITERKRAELERVSAQERLKEAHRLAQIGTWDWVMETDTVTWSEELCNIAGWDLSLPAPTYAEFPHIYTPSSWELLSKAVTRAITTGEPYNLELEMIRPDGSIRWTNAFGGMNRDGEGKVIGLHGTVQDITGRKRAEEALRTSEEKFRKAFFTSPNSICITRLSDGLFISINKGFTEITGYTEEDVAGKTSLEINIWKDPEDRRKIVEGLKAHGEVRNYEARFLTKTGEIYGSMSTSIIDLNGVPHILNITHDLTERKKAEEALIRNAEDLHSAYEELTASEEELRQNVDDLAKSEQSLRTLNAYNRSLLEASLDSLVTINPDGKIADVNTSTEKITGYSREELIGTDFSDYFTEPELAKEGYQRVFTDGTVRNYPLSIRNRDGHITTVLYNATVYRDELWNVGGVFAAARDITERKVAEENLLKKNEELNASYQQITAAEEELRANLDELTRQEQELTESKRELTDIIEFLPDATFVIDRKGIVIAWNRAMEEMTGIKKEAMIGKGDHEYTIPFYGERRQQLLDLIDLDDEGLKAKYQNITRKGQTLYAEVFTPALYGGKGAYVWATGSPLFDVNGNHIGAIESIRDITERKRAEEELRTASGRLLSIVESTSDVIAMMDTEYRYTLFNTAFHDEFKKIFGPDIKIGDLMPRALAHLPDDLANAKKYWDRALGGEEFTVTQQFGDTKRERNWYDFSYSPIRGSEGKVIGAMHIVRNATGRKLAEESVRASHERLTESEADLRTHQIELEMQAEELRRSKLALEESRNKYIDLYDFAPLGYLTLNDKGLIDEVNLTGATLLGVERSKLINARIRKFIAQPDQNVWDRYFIHVLNHDEKQTCTLMLTLGDGSTFPVQLESIRIIRSNGAKTVRVAISDITERKVAEKALHDSEDRYRTLVEHIPQKIFIKDRNSRYVSINENYANDLGIHPDKIVGKSDADIFPAKLAAKYRADDIRIMETGQTEEFEERYVNEGVETWVHTIKTVIRDKNGEASGVCGVFWDITGRKNAEDALHYQNEMRQTILDNIPVMVGFFDRKGHYQLINRCWQSTLGWSLEEMLQHKDVFAEFYPDPEYRKYVMDYITKAVGAGRWSDFKTRRRDGHVLDTSWINVPLSDGSIIGLGIDITERKRAEDALRESENRYSTLFNTIIEGVVLISPDGQIVQANPAAEYILGLTHSEIENRQYDSPDWEILRTDGTPMPPEEMAGPRAIREKCLVKDVVMGAKRPDGFVSWINVNAVPQLSEGGVLKGVVGTFQDITERKRTEEALQESEEKYRQLFELEADAILLVDKETGNLVEANRIAELLYGYSREEFLNMKNTELSSEPDETKRATQEAWKHIPVRYHRKKDGTIFPVEITVNILHWQGRQVHLAAIRDITERKKTEETIQHALAEKEVLLREIHHRVKNNLAGIISLIELQINTLTDPASISQFKELETRIRSMVLVHESLYLTKDLARVNVATYTENLTRHLFQSYGTATEIRCRIEMGDITIPLETATPCGLVMSEIITNSLKYAFPKTFNCAEIRKEPCTIALTLHREGDDYLLNVSDNGIGMPEGIDVTMSHSLGRFLIRFIVEHQLNGSLELNTSGGTAYTIRFAEPEVQDGHTDE